MSKSFNRVEKKFDSSQEKFFITKNNSNELNEAMEKIKYIFIEKENKITQNEEKIDSLTTENKTLLDKIEALTSENRNLSNQINTISRELLIANQKVDELTKEKLKSSNINIHNNSKTYINSNHFESDYPDIKSPNSGNTTTVKFPNNITVGLNNIKNIDESELNESDYNNPTFNNLNYNNPIAAQQKPTIPLYIESDNYKNEKNKLQQINKFDAEKNKIMVSGGVPNLRINNNSNLGINNSNYIINSKNNFNDSNPESLVNIENRSSSYQKYNRNPSSIMNQNQNNGFLKDSELSLKSSKDKFNPINYNINNILNNSKNISNINNSKGNIFAANANNNLNTESNYNASKINDSENSGRSSPLLKNTKNSFYAGKGNMVESSNRIITESDVNSNQVIKNRIPMSNKSSNYKSDGLKENNIPRNYVYDSNKMSKYQDSAEISDIGSNNLYREKSTGNFYNSSDYESSKYNPKYETSKQTIPSKYSNNGNNYNSNSEFEYNINSNTNKNLSPIPNNNKINSNISNTPNVLSPKLMGQDSRDDIKEFLLKVKERIPPKEFKDFIGDIKMLTDKNNSSNKKEIINHVNSIFQNHRDLYARFEEILLIKKY